ncbi:MAG: PGRS repeat-containing protein, partial [Mycobacterium sp.]
MKRSTPTVSDDADDADDADDTDVDDSDDDVDQREVEAEEAEAEAEEAEAEVDTYSPEVEVEVEVEVDTDGPDGDSAEGLVDNAADPIGEAAVPPVSHDRPAARAVADPGTVPVALSVAATPSTPANPDPVAPTGMLFNSWFATGGRCGLICNGADGTEANPNGIGGGWLLGDGGNGWFSTEVGVAGGNGGHGGLLFG